MSLWKRKERTSCPYSFNLHDLKTEFISRSQKTQKIVKIKRKPEKKRAAGVISGGRDSEAAEYISGLQVTEINWSRQHPSVIPHFTSLLLTRRTKILTHKVQPRVCVCPRTCRAVCEHVRCAMCAHEATSFGTCRRQSRTKICKCV